MAPTKKSSNKPAGKFKLEAGGSGKMRKFGGAAAQKSGVSATTNMTGKGADTFTAGPSGKMQKFTAVKAVKKA